MTSPEAGFKKPQKKPQSNSDILGKNTLTHDPRPQRQPGGGLENKDSHRKLMFGIGAATLGAAIALGSFLMGGKGEAKTETPVPTTVPTAEAPVTPGTDAAPTTAPEVTTTPESELTPTPDEVPTPDNITADGEPYDPAAIEAARDKAEAVTQTFEQMPMSHFANLPKAKQRELIEAHREYLGAFPDNPGDSVFDTGSHTGLYKYKNSNPGPDADPQEAWGSVVYDIQVATGSAYGLGLSKKLTLMMLSSTTPYAVDALGNPVMPNGGEVPKSVQAMFGEFNVIADGINENGFAPMGSTTNGMYHNEPIPNLDKNVIWFSTSNEELKRNGYNNDAMYAICYNDDIGRWQLCGAFDDRRS